LPPIGPDTFSKFKRGRNPATTLAQWRGFPLGATRRRRVQRRTSTSFLVANRFHRRTLFLFLRFELLEECSEMQGDGGRQSVILVFEALPNC
jgi:hypothetical protein